MTLDGPDRYHLTVPSGRFSVKAALGDNRLSARASGRGSKLYIVHDRGLPVYVGITKQPIAARLRYGWSASGKHGYHGYAWRHALKSVGFDIWYCSNAGADGSSDILETIEAEVVYLHRTHFGQWPRFQTEIHFHRSSGTHRKLARHVMGIYLERGGA
jgi:hypothetical protein